MAIKSQRANKGLPADASAQPSTAKQEEEDEYETCCVGQSTCSFPQELLELADLKGVLSLEAWNFCLTEEEREQLMGFLPQGLDQAGFASTLQQLLSGENLNFGSPLDSFFRMLKDGELHPEVVLKKGGLRTLQKNDYHHQVRNYHNGMVNTCLEVQKLFEEYPHLELEERLEVWRKWKQAKAKPSGDKALNAVLKAKAASAAKVTTSKQPNGSNSVQKEAAASNGKQPAKKSPVKEASKSTKTVAAKISKCSKPKGLLKTTKKSSGTAAAVRSSPLSDSDTSTGDESPVRGTSSSASGERKRKSTSLTEVQEQKRVKADESANSSDDDVKPEKQQVRATDLQCAANCEASSEEGAVKAKRKQALESTKSSGMRPIPATISEFPFSPVQFLSAVRRALLSPYSPAKEAANSSAASSPVQDMDENGSSDNDGFSAGSFPVPFSEIVKRVRESPGDTRVLELHETSLQDLVWGALKVFSSKVAPGKAKGWKPLATYDKEAKSWYWLGVQNNTVGADSEKLADEWGIPLKTLAKVEDAFATWYKHGEATRQQMVQLQVPPPVVSTPLDEKERFRDMRAQKSLITITPSSQDMRAYFRKEELVRYSVPERIFTYTRSDGQKSVVAPLRRAGGKPREHSMLKPDRPAHVNILCLVRDAAARLPGGVGTRADVCALIRDSQYVVEDATDSQVNQVVSGALDRLHYERDPCVRFDSERKLWVYLHTNRTEEDFEDDGTSSTKRWKKQKKDSGPAEGHLESSSPEQEGPVRVPIASAMELDASGSVHPSAIYSVGRTELVYNRSSSLASPRVLNGGVVEMELSASATAAVHQNVRLP